MHSFWRKFLVSPVIFTKSLISLQCRTTYIVRRVIEVPPLDFKSTFPLKPYKPEHFLYELVDDVDAKDDPDIQVVLLAFVEGIGQAGDVVTVPADFARAKLLLPKRAVYASPENIKEFALKMDGFQKTYSSHTVPLTIQMLSSQVVGVPVSATIPWTLEPWHIRAGFRLSGLAVPEDSIELPEEEISGPDPNKQNKDFLAFVTINETEKAPVRCRVHHIGEELYPEWKYIASEPIFSSQAEALAKLHLPKKVEKATNKPNK